MAEGRSLNYHIKPEEKIMKRLPSTVATLLLAAMAQALPAIKKRADDMDARADALYGAWFCGIVLPHALAYNAAAAPAAMQEIAEALNGNVMARSAGGV